MSGAEFGFAGGVRRIPLVDDYETLRLMRDRGHFAALSAKEQAQAVAWLEGPIGRLVCALEDARDAATEARNVNALAGINGALRFAWRAFGEVEPLRPVAEMATVCGTGSDGGDE
jgi:hypothetical protein